MSLCTLDSFFFWKKTVILKGIVFQRRGSGPIVKEWERKIFLLISEQITRWHIRTMLLCKNICFQFYRRRKMKSWNFPVLWTKARELNMKYQPLLKYQFFCNYFKDLWRKSQGTSYLNKQNIKKDNANY